MTARPQAKQQVKQARRPAGTPDAGSDTPEGGLSLENIFALVQVDFSAVNALIPRRLTSDVEMVEKIGTYIIDSGGKRLRPLLVLLSARLLNYPGQDHVKLAAVIEFLHTATLLHDDVVDTLLFGAGALPRMPSGAMRPAFWSGTFSTAGLSSSWSSWIG